MPKKNSRKFKSQRYQSDDDENIVQNNLLQGSDNYDQWKDDMYCELNALGLLKYCLDTDYASTDESSSDEDFLLTEEQRNIRANKIASKKLRLAEKKREKRRSKAASKINNRLSQGIKNVIPLETKINGKQLLEYLKKNYEEKNITSLLFEFFTLEQREGESLESWFQRLRSVKQKIANSFNLPDIYVSAKLLHQSEYKYRL
ncbi:hypothetical protein HK096_008933, partial [Nowakowskiella sp. JEL0078]